MVRKTHEILRQICTKWTRFPRRLCPRPLRGQLWGAYSAPPGPAVFQGPACKGNFDVGFEFRPYVPEAHKALIQHLWCTFCVNNPNRKHLDRNTDECIKCKL